MIAYSPFSLMSIFLAMSECSGLKMMTRPFQFVVKSVLLQVGHSLPRTKVLHFLHAFFFAIIVSLFF